MTNSTKSSVDLAVDSTESFLGLDLAAVRAPASRGRGNMTLRRLAPILAWAQSKDATPLDITAAMGAISRRLKERGPSKLALGRAGAF